MSGHSKWATIKRQKALTDKKRGVLFSKLASSIAVAVKESGENPQTNFKLRLVIEQAKAINMPKDVIERAINRGVGATEKPPEEVLYEGFGPAGVALVIEALTDNHNRTTSELRHILNQQGGGLGGSGSTIWMFKRRGVLKIVNFKLQIADLEEFELKAIEAGAEDIKEEGDELTILTKPGDLQKIKEYLEKEKIRLDYTGLEWFADNLVEIDQATKQKLGELFEAFDDHPDVTDYYTNAK